MCFAAQSENRENDIDISIQENIKMHIIFRLCTRLTCCRNGQLRIFQAVDASLRPPIATVLLTRPNAIFRSFPPSFQSDLGSPLKKHRRLRKSFEQKTSRHFTEEIEGSLQKNQQSLENFAENKSENWNWRKEIKITEKRRRIAKKTSIGVGKKKLGKVLEKTYSFIFKKSKISKQPLIKDGLNNLNHF